MASSSPRRALFVRTTLLRTVVVASAVWVVGCTDEREAPIETVARSGNPIVDGTVDETDKGAVGLALSAFGFFQGHCSGTLIAPNLVLTARHCVSLTMGGGPDNSVVCGETGFGLTGEGSYFRVTTLTDRPNQDGDGFYEGVGALYLPPDADDICGNDVALIQLAGAGIPASEATPIVPRIDVPAIDDEVYAAIGYGLTDPNDQNSSGTRMRLDGNDVTCHGGECGGSIGESVKPTEWLGGSGTCPGDSGGPALDSMGRVIGVLSRGIQPCGSSTYGDVASWKDLITAAALQAAMDGGYEPPFWATTGSSTPPPDDPPIAVPGPGAMCTDACEMGYVCYAADGVNRTCVEACDAATACPMGKTCDVAASACVPETTTTVTVTVPPPADPEEDDGCAAAPRSRDGLASAALTMLALLGSLGAVRRSRRRR